jgi:DNA-binding GntR family transcriptional regulator
MPSRPPFRWRTRQRHSNPFATRSNVCVPILLKLQLPMATNLREEARHHRAADGVKRHREILSALETNDPTAVVAALEEHGHLHYLGLESHR